jgi:hypothetical protein
MKKNYSWGSSSPVTWSYTINNVEKLFKKENCYSSMISKADFITLYNLDCEKTIKYKMFYLQYVSNMYDLNAKITEEYFKFKCQDCRYKNMLICATIRLLWENINTITPAIPMHDVFFEKKLQNNKSKYENKLERFYDFYSQINIGSYFSDGHSWRPSKTLIKPTLDFKKKIIIDRQLMNFFYNKS